MADKFLGGDIVSNSTSVSVPIFLRDKDNLTGVTSLTYADVIIKYWRQSENVENVSPVVLGSLDAAYDSGGFIEAEYGSYRIDLPNAMIASGADWVMLFVEVNASGFDVFTYPFLFTLTSNVKQSSDAGPKLDRLLGINFENSYQYSQVYVDGKLISYSLDVYDSKSNAIAHDGSTGLVSSYIGLFTYSGENIASFQVTREA